MRKLRRFLPGPKGQTHCYHVVSRFAGPHIVFGESEREFFRTLLRRQLRFSGLRTLAWCCLGNHFHLLLEVPDKERAIDIMCQTQNKKIDERARPDPG
ncbi:MAG TPA: hypothetical protein VMN36_07760 [Verrucomicrobiales bacterium]|nr:hypothetical protein [Verrucomicrobiales bacterium]